VARPLSVFVVVTLLFLAYGHAWSWVAGPIAALAVWAFAWKAGEPTPPAPARRREPSPVD
jgi:hypothetical protein